MRRRQPPGDFKPNRSIDWNGDVTFLADPTPELEIASNGNIVTAEGVTVNGVSTGSVSGILNVSPIVNMDGGSATFTVNDNVLTGLTAPAGEITGSGGTIGSGSTFPSVDIINRSNEILVLNDIKLSNATDVPDVSLTAETVTLTFDIGNIAPAGDLEINILNEGFGEVRINGLIENPGGLTRIENQGGAIVSTDADGIIRGQRIDLISGAEIGNNAQRLNADLITSVGRATDLDVQAAGDIWLNLTGRIRDINSANSLFAAGRVETSAGDVDILFQTSLQETESTGFAAGVSVRVLSDTDSIDPAEQFREKFRPDEASPTAAPLNILYFADTTQTVPVDGSYSFEQITGANINLNAANTAVDAKRVGVTANTDHGGAGRKLDALLTGDIHLTETVGDFRIGTIRSNQGNVHLETTDTTGNIFEITVGDNGMVPFVIGNDITLLTDGTIGFVDDFLEIDSSLSAPGKVDARAGLDVFLTETAGDLNLDAALARQATGAVSILVKAGSIFDVEADTDTDDPDYLRADIQASKIDLKVIGGGIGRPASGGELASDLEIYGGGINQVLNTGFQIDPTDGVSNPGPGRLWVEADQSVHLMEINGALNVLSVTSNNGDVELRAKDGGGPDEGINLLAAGGTTLLGVVIPVGVIDAADNVVISAGDDVTLEAGTSVTAGVSVEINGDSGAGIIDVDGNGTTIDLSGDITTPTLTVSGGGQTDFIQVRRPGQIDTSVSTTINGGDEKDHFFIQYADDPMTINGESGDDRFYFTSISAKSLFESGGFFSEANVDFIETLKGDLTDINATVTVNTGPGSATVANGVYVSGSGSVGPLTGMFDGGSITGMGMPGRIDIVTPTTPDTDPGTTVVIGLSDFADQFEIKTLPATTFAAVEGGEGNDTLNVGKTNASVVGIDGVIGFFGDEGDGDVLNVYGDALAPVGGQLTGIGITGMGMGRNQKLTTHNDRFGADLSFPRSDYPAAIYYGIHDLDTAGTPILSTVEEVNVHLGGGDDVFAIDSTYDHGVTNVHAGGGDDVLTVGSTASGLNQGELANKVDFIDGELNLFGDGGFNTIRVDDREDEDVGGNVGTFAGDQVTGLDISGSVSFDGADIVEIYLGKTANQFFVPSLDADQNLLVNGGLSGDKFYIGSTAAQIGPGGTVTGGSLDSIAGIVHIEGALPLSRDRLFINDHDTSVGQTYSVTNPIMPDSTAPLAFVTRSGMAGQIKYGTIETAVLNTSSGNDTVDLHATHRNQPGGDGASTFTVNAGDGADKVNIGEPVTGGFSLARFAIDLPDSMTDVKGIRVLVNGQAGEDTIHFLNTAPDDDQSLAFVQKTFSDIFPPGGDSPTSLELFTEIFGQPPEPAPDSTSYSEVILSSASEITVDEVTGQVNQTFDVSTPATGGTFALQIIGPNDIQVDLPAIPYNIEADGSQGLKALIEATGLVDVNVTDLSDPILNKWQIEFTDPDSGIELSADGLKLTQSPPLNINSRLTEAIEVSLGSGDDVIQLVSSTYENDITINTDGGKDTFVIEKGVIATGHKIQLNGQGDDDIVFVDFQTGVPNGTIPSLTFDGGDNGAFGDKFRIAGDGNATGTYTPSATEARAGVIDLSGNHFVFKDVEPLVIHGLADFDVINPDAAAVLDLDSILVNDLDLRNLVLHTLTVDGVVSWQRFGGDLNLLDVAANEPKHIGRAAASNYTTLVVGSALRGAEHGAAYVYNWNTTFSRWDQIAKLLPDDRPEFGQEFGVSVAINETDTILVVGAPGDDEHATNPALTRDQSGAVYVFEKLNNAWVQTAKLKASDSAVAARFGESVAISGTTIVVGSPGDDDAAAPSNANWDEAYVFNKPGSTWSETSARWRPGTDYGRSVAVSGSRIVVGAPAASGVGRAYATLGNLTSSEKLLEAAATDRQNGERFGESVAIDGSRVVVGAPLWNDGENDEGRAFIFDGSNYDLVARLTADDGLPQSDADEEGEGGDQFGASVDVSGDYVVVGAPFASVNDYGAAYVFYELDDVTSSGLKSTWTRSTGGSGSGRLEAMSQDGIGVIIGDPAAEVNQYQTADRFATSVTVSGLRVVAGIPGHNEPNSDDNGGFQTFTPTGVNGSNPEGTVPTPTNANMRAETLTDAARDFGSRTAYDPDSRTLVVASPGQSSPGQGAIRGKIDFYINEGLSWRHQQTIDSPNVSAGSNFAADIDFDGTTLVVGMPFDGSTLVGGVPVLENPSFFGEVHVYEFSNGSWGRTERIFGNNYSFGSSVAVDGDNIVVGAPEQTVTYKSDNQPGSLGNHKVTLANSGAAYVYTRNGSGAWPTSPSRLLMPDDNSLPESWHTEFSTPAGANTVFMNGTSYGMDRHYLGNSNDTSGTLGPYTFALFIDESSSSLTDGAILARINDTGSNASFNLPGDQDDDLEWLFVGSTRGPVAANLLDENQNVIATFGETTVTDGFFSHTPSTERYIQSVGASFAVAVTSDGGNYGQHHFSRGGHLTDLNHDGRNINSDVEVVWIAGNLPVVEETDTPDFFTDLDNAGWGSSVDIVGNRIVVGAPGFGDTAGAGTNDAAKQGRVAVYDLGRPDTTKWNVEAGTYTGDVLESSEYITDSAGNRLGTELAFVNADVLYAGAPGYSSNAGAVNKYDVTRFSAFNYGISYQSSPGFGSANQNFGLDESIAAQGNRVLLGAPGDSSNAGLAQYKNGPTGGNIGPTLQPFLFDNVNEQPDLSTSKRFGVGSSIISEGHFVIGTEASEILYNFRQRGPAWTVEGGITVPDPIPRSKLGFDLAIDGDTAVLGAPDYDNTGGAFVFRNDGTQWNLESTLQSAGIEVGDKFGSSVAIHGDSIVVGAPDVDSKGRVYVFDRVGNRWLQSDQIDAQTGNTRFGNSVGIGVDTLVIGAVNSDKAYVFELDRDDWILDDTLTGPAGSMFGFDVAIDGGKILVGAPSGNAGNGNASVFVENEITSNWSQEGTALVAPAGSSGDKFGHSVAISGNSALIGAPGVAGMSGAAYFFDHASGAWSHNKTVSLDDAAAGDQFGFSVSLEGGAAAIGAPYRDLNDPLATPTLQANAGAAFVYGRNKQGIWKHETEAGPIGPAVPLANDNAGYSVGIAVVLEPDPITGNLVASQFVIAAAPQVEERTVTDVKDIDGIGYPFKRDVAPPSTVTVPILQETLIAGAQANVLRGNVGGNELARLSFFDVLDVSVQTGSHDDQFTLHEEGLTAYGLAKFTVNTNGGNDTFTTLSGELTPTADGTVIRTGDFTGATVGQTPPAGAGHSLVEGNFTFDAGTGTNTLVADNDPTNDVLHPARKSTNFNWKLETNRLSSGDEFVTLANFSGNARLYGGGQGNIIEAKSWMGPLSIDGRGRSDQIKVNLAGVMGANVVDSAGAADQLIAVGSEGPDSIRVFATDVSMLASVIGYTGIESIRINGLGGNDTLYVFDSSSARVFLDGEGGSDTYQVELGLDPSGPVVNISDSGPAQNNGVGDEDTLNLPAGLGSQTVNIPFLVGGKSVVFDGTIERQATNPLPTLGTPGDDTIELNNGMLIVSFNGQPSVSYDISSAIDLIFNSLGGKDTFTIVSKLPTLASIDFRGGDDTDTLIGPNGTNTWNITGANQGDIAGDVPLVFADIENMTGGSLADVFLLGPASEVAGSINGGTGSNSIEFTTTSADDTVAVTALAVTVNGGITDYLNIGSLDLNTLGGVDTVTVTGTGDGNIIAVDGLNVTFDATVIALVDVENLTVEGGDGEDQLSLTGTSVTGNLNLFGQADHDVITLNYPIMGGSLNVNGGPGTEDELVVNNTDQADVTITAGTVAVAGSTTANHSQVEKLTVDTAGVANVDDSPGSDELTVTAPTININTTTVTTSGRQVYNGPMTLSVDTTSASGVAVTINGTVDGTTAGTESLTINGNAEFNSRLGSSISLKSLSVSGATAMNARVVTTSKVGGGSGDQTYMGPVTLVSDTTLFSDGGKVILGSTVDGTTPREESLIIIERAEFGGAIGGQVPLESLLVTSLAHRAYALKQQFNLTSTGNYHENLIMLGEKWLRGNGGWYYITKTGDVFRWMGNVANSVLVGTLNASYHQDPTKLHNARYPFDEFAQMAFDLDQQANLRSNGNYHESLIQLGEKWVRGDDGWYFIKPNGEIYRWGGSIATSVQVAFFDSSYHANPQKLHAATNPKPAQTAYDLDQKYNLTFKDNYHQNLIHLGEKWMRGDDDWFFITPNGRVYRWTGNVGSSELVGMLDSTYHDDTTKLHDAPDPNAYRNGNTTVSVQQAAYELDRQHSLRFAGHYYENRIGLGEKWMRGNNGWFFIKSDGTVYRWNGSLATSQRVGTLDASYFTDPSKLHDAARPNTNGNRNATVSVAQAAYDLDRQHRLKFAGSYYENRIGLGEKWMRGDDGWYFIKGDGTVYRWNGSLANIRLLATLNASYHTDPSKLHNAPST